MQNDGLNITVCTTPRWHPPIYNFMNKRFLPAFLKRGCVRIGTSQEYRIPDGFSDGRSDAEEVQWRWSPGPREVTIDPDSDFMKSVFGSKPRPAVPVKVIFGEDAQLVNRANGYIYSASNEYSDDLARRMAEKFDANACVRINDPRAFMIALSKHPLLDDRPYYQQNVEYVVSNKTDEFQHADAFKKLNQFEWQKEFRTIWGGEGIPEGGSVIEVPSIVPLLEKM